MANDMWLPTSNELRRQFNTKMLETEKDFWMETNEMLQGMLDSIFDAVKKGESITIRRNNGEIITIPPSHEKSSADGV